MKPFNRLPWEARYREIGPSMVLIPVLWQNEANVMPTYSTSSTCKAQVKCLTPEQCRHTSIHWPHHNHRGQLATCETFFLNATTPDGSKGRTRSPHICPVYCKYHLILFCHLKEHLTNVNGRRYYRPGYCHKRSEWPY